MPTKDKMEAGLLSLPTPGAIEEAEAVVIEEREYDPDADAPALVLGVQGEGDQILQRVCKRIGIRAKDFLEESKVRGWYNAAPCLPQVGDIVCMEYGSLAHYWYAEVQKTGEGCYSIAVAWPFTAPATELVERWTEAGLKNVTGGTAWNDAWKVRAFIRIPAFLSEI